LTGTYSSPSSRRAGSFPTGVLSTSRTWEPRSAMNRPSPILRAAL
jgi:hypothetical protein